MDRSRIGRRARISRTAVIGQYCIIEDGTEIGPGTIIGNWVLIRRGARIGRDNVIHAGAQIATDPQDTHYKGEDTACVIGDNNIIREYVTISKATGRGTRTVIGNNNFIMTYVHVAHNARIGSNVVIASGTQLGGHVEVGDHATIGGLAGVHQYCRIGDYAMLGAKSYLNKDLPPYFLARGNCARTYGVNTKGLRRNGFSAGDIERIREIYRLIYKSELALPQAIKVLRSRCPGRYLDAIVKFARGSTRGILLKPG
jgi:UDP-N-acetylglucosamine acyltransferase